LHDYPSAFDEGAFCFDNRLTGYGAAEPTPERPTDDGSGRRNMAALSLPWMRGTRPTLNLQRQTYPLSQHHSITDPQRRYTKEASARRRKP
jgi:hypothetical protein